MSYGFGRINDLCHEAHKNSRNHGFWDAADNTDSALFALSRMALITSEVGEAVEAIRKDDMENLREELADICIRVFDFSGGLQINLEQAIIDKMEKNRNRPRMHGKNS